MNSFALTVEEKDLKHKGLIDVYATKTLRKVSNTYSKGYSKAYYYVVRSSLGVKLSDPLNTLDETFAFCRANNLFLRALK